MGHQGSVVEPSHVQSIDQPLRGLASIIPHRSHWYVFAAAPGSTKVSSGMNGAALMLHLLNAIALPLGTALPTLQHLQCAENNTQWTPGKVVLQLEVAQMVLAWVNNPL